MADNVDITAGTGTTIATDDCTTGQVQLVKLAYSADGDRTHATVDATGILVNLGSNNDVTVTGTVDLGATDNAVLDQIDANTDYGAVVGGGAEATALRVTLANDSTGVLSVDDNGGALTVDNGGTFAVQAAQSGSWTNTVTQSTASSLNAQVVGAAADAATASGNPVSLGATARTANRTSVSDGQAVRVASDKQGRLVAVGAIRDLVTHQHTQIASSAAETTIITAAASTYHDIISLVITNQTATAVNVTIKDSTAGTTRMIIALAANGGAVITPMIPIPQLAATNNNWTATLSSAAVTVNFFAQFVKNV